MHKIRQTLLLAIVFKVTLFNFSFAQPIIDLDSFATGLIFPVDIAHANDDRLFVVGKGGIIQIVDADGNVSPTPFLDITDRVVGPNPPDERGLLGLAFHPNYEENGFLYVNYTGEGNTSFISRFEVSENNPDQVNPGSELILLNVDQPFANHNAGDLAFGEDGYLYIPLGDGGAGGDPGDRSQNQSNLLGKILRIDVDNPSDGLNYGIPVDNPFLDDDNVRDEIFATGLRNPWRFSFDRETGDIWIGDVGQSAWEEISYLPADEISGANFGWRCLEGSSSFVTNGIGCESMDQFIRPVFEYRNNPNADGCSVTGGYVYRGSEYKLLNGTYVFADYCSGKFWTITPDEGGEFEVIDQGPKDRFEYSTFGENQNGELFVAAMNDGIIYRVTEVCSPLKPSVSQDGATLMADMGDAFVWFRDGEAIAGADDATYEPTENGVYTVRTEYENGCSILSDPFEYTLVSNLNLFDEGEITFMPNPFSDQAILQFPNPNRLAYEVKLIDLQGRVLYNRKNIRTEEVAIDGSHVPGGIYILSLSGEKQYFGKVEILD